MKYPAVLLMLLVPAAALAQGTATPLTLDEALAQGLANSRRLAEIEARAEAADFATSARRAAELPSVSVMGGYTRTNHVDEFSITFPGRAPQVVYPDIPDNYRARLDLQWPIYTGGRADALERAARAERGAVGKDLDAARADLRLEITRAYWAAVTAGETEAVLRRSVEAVDAHVKDVRARLASGLIPPNDVSSAEAQASHERLLALEAANQRATAEADLARLTGRANVTVAIGAAAPPSPSADTPVSGLIARAMKERAERQALEQRVVSAEERANAVAAGARPQIAVGSGYDYARPNPRIFPRTDAWKTSWDASINLTWTLWDGGRRAAEYGEARATAKALKTRVEDFDRQVTFEVRSRLLELQSSRQGVAAADDEIRAAVDAERVVGERYKAGVATSTEVLDAQIARLQAELDRARAVANVRLAEARLERAVGH
ncbi:MAG TPA: TolC family protein [Vicinamibacterales bacterium]|nr:TolC family protein [Vicinamibacterales bacterium]